MLIVEQGDGQDPDANSYTSIQESEEVLLKLGYSEFPSETDLIQATLYIDTWLNPVSAIYDEDQPLLWPRKSFKDSQGRTVEGIPSELKRATAIIAAEFIESDLFDPSTGITEEQYGNSRVKYAGVERSESGRVNGAMQRLKRLGYGSGSSSITLTRA